MTTFNRWCVVALGVVVLGASLVLVPRLWSAGSATLGKDVGDSVTAGELLKRVRKADGTPYSGFVETTGALQIPVASRFTDVGQLFGEQTRMRVWWRAATDWRVDKLLAAGETDLIHHGQQTVEWSYEKAEASAYFDPDIRLPRTSDLVPPALGQRAVTDVKASDVTRIGDRVVAGAVGLGLRIKPSSSQSSIDHVDLWADAVSGITLRVEVYDGPASSASFSSEFRSFEAKDPGRDSTRFQPPAGAKLSTDDVLDIADAANQYADAVPPPSLAGLPQSEQTRGAVGVYGAGITQLIAIPIWDRGAEPLRKQLRASSAATELVEGLSLSLGPLNVVLTEVRDGSGWLIAGTVDHEAILTAAHELRSRPPDDHHH